MKLLEMTRRALDFSRTSSEYQGSRNLRRCCTINVQYTYRKEYFRLISLIKLHTKIIFEKCSITGRNVVLTNYV